MVAGIHLVEVASASGNLEVGLLGEEMACLGSGMAAHPAHLGKEALVAYLDLLEVVSFLGVKLRVVRAFLG